MAEKGELARVLDILDTWIDEQNGLTQMQFSYETSSGYAVTLVVSKKRRPSLSEGVAIGQPIGHGGDDGR